MTFDRKPLGEVEPVETDEHGGFRVEVPKLYLNKSMVRRPGLVQFLPSRWPFSDVLAAEVGDVELEQSPTLLFRQGRLVVSGWAEYTVVTDDGERDKAYLPLQGVFVRMNPSLEEKLESLQSPPQESLAGARGGDDRVRLLRELLGRVGEWGKPLVEEAVAALQAGKPLDAETLKGIRYRMYRSDMADEAVTFKEAGVKAGSSMSELFKPKEQAGGPLMTRRDYNSEARGSKTASEHELNDLHLEVNARLGSCVLRGNGELREVAQVLTRAMLPKLLGVGGRAIPKPPGKYRGFDFHWSNAQSAWDVITATPNGDVDGATFVLWCPLDGSSLSPLGRPWTLKEMQYVAKYLGPHPAYAFSYERSRVAHADMARRIALRYAAHHKK
jgi:hypothetical protein